jgi:hypothetical protein
MACLHQFGAIEAQMPDSNKRRFRKQMVRLEHHREEYSQETQRRRLAIQWP